MEKVEKACVMCGAPLPASAGGRPPSYCAVACRRQKEFRRRVAARWLAQERRLRAEGQQALAEDYRAAAAALEAAGGTIAPASLKPRAWPIWRWREDGRS